MKNFTKEQARAREELLPLLTLYEVRTILALSEWAVTELIQQGKLRAFNVRGDKLKRTQVNINTMKGLKVCPLSVQELLDVTEVE